MSEHIGAFWHIRVRCTLCGRVGRVVHRDDVEIVCPCGGPVERSPGPEDAIAESGKRTLLSDSTG